MEIPFCGQTYSDRTLDANAQRSINLYPFLSPTDRNPRRFVMYPTPSFYLAIYAISGGLRGLISINNNLYFVSGSVFYKYTPTSSSSPLLTQGSYTAVGTLNTSTGTCSIVTNTIQIVISDGTYGYCYNINTGQFSYIGYQANMSANATATATNVTLTFAGTTTGNTNSNTTITNIANTAILAVGQTVSGTGIPVNTTITAVSGNVVTISNPATSSGTGVSLTLGATVTANTTSGSNVLSNISNINWTLATLTITGSGIPSSTTVSSVTVGGAFPSTGVTNLTYQDGFVIAAINNSKEVIISNALDASTWNALSVDNIYSYPDNIVAVFSDGLQLYVFGPKFTEVQYDAGTYPYPFARVQGVLIKAGCAAVNSICLVGNTIMFLASDIAGKAYVAALNGYQTEPLSTAPINEQFERYMKVSDAFAYTYREGENQFYVITFPTANVTWAYDLKTKQWHERQYNGGADLVTYYVTWNGNHVVSDSSGNLYLMSQDYPNTGDTFFKVIVPSPRIRTCQTLMNDGNGIFMDELYIDMETGLLNANMMSYGEAIAGYMGNNPPQATLEVSRDGGHVWHNLGQQSLGLMGQYIQRAIWRRLGRFKNRATFRLTVTDNVRVYILAAYAKVRGSSK